jgi:hypothetical protein
MKVVATLVAALLLALPAPALALRFEAFGNAPLDEGGAWADGVRDVVNLDTRVYAQTGDGPHLFFYRGEARALNEAIGKFAAVKAKERRLVLLPGQGTTRSFAGQAVDFHWRLHVPAGRYLAVSRGKYAVLTAYINVAKARGAVDRKQTAAWIADLADDRFPVRQNASRELEKLGAAAKPLLREALKGNLLLEPRRRIEVLLAKLKGPDASDLEIPAGVEVVTAGDLLKEHLEGLKDPTLVPCFDAMGGLVELAADFDEVVPALAGVLKNAGNEQIRRVAAVCLGDISAGARGALPALKAALGDADVNVRAASQRAIEQIEKAAPEPGREGELQRRRLILDDLGELKKARG